MNLRHASTSAAITSSMEMARCDFCQNRIVAPSPEQAPVITYLPCFHAICQRCKEARHRVTNAGRTSCPIACAVCQYPSSLMELYDLLLPTSICPMCNARTRLECTCQNCNADICAPCSITHHQRSGHLIGGSRRLDLPQRSQCIAHPNACATCLCSCGIQLCDLCAITHEEQPGHAKTSYVVLAEASRQRLLALQKASETDNSAIHRDILPLINRNRAIIQSRAATARSAVASEVVDLCNAVIRRGNDIVHAIDLAAEGKFKQLAKTEDELKSIKDRFDKLNYFLQMALGSHRQDMPGSVSASMFAGSAYKLICDKRHNVGQSMRLGEPYIAYCSDQRCLLSALKNFGQLNIDGTLKTPPSVSHTDERMFSVANGATSSTSSSRSTPHASRNNLSQMGPSFSQSLHQSSSQSHLQQTVANQQAHHQQHHQQQQQQRQQLQAQQHQNQQQLLHEQQQILRYQQQQQQMAQQHFIQQRSHSIGEMASPQSIPSNIGHSIPNSPLFPQHFQQIPHPQIACQGRMVESPQLQHCNNNGRQQSRPTGASSQSMSDLCSLSVGTVPIHPVLNPHAVVSGATESHSATNVHNSHIATDNRGVMSSPAIPSTLGTAIEQLLNSHAQRHQSQSANTVNLCGNVVNQQPQRNTPSAQHSVANRVEIFQTPLSPEENIQQLGSSPSTSHHHVPNSSFQMQNTQDDASPVVRTSADSTVIISSALASPLARTSRTLTTESSFGEGKQVDESIRPPAKRMATDEDDYKEQKSMSEMPDSADIHMRALSLFAASPSAIFSMCNGSHKSRESASIPSVQKAEAGISTAKEAGGDNVPRDVNEDRWDDYCYVCQEGVDDESGELGCCDGQRCPRVFHARCHVPAISVKMKELPDDWKCSTCQAKDLKLTEPSPSFGEIEQLLCSSVLLSCFKEADKAAHFRSDSSKPTTSGSAVTEGISLDDIAQRVSAKVYSNVIGFVGDMNLLFKNCSTYNAPSSAKALAGKYVYTLFLNATRRHLPAYEKYIWSYVMLYKEDLSALRIRIKRPRREGSVAKSTVSN